MVGDDLLGIYSSMLWKSISKYSFHLFRVIQLIWAFMMVAVFVPYIVMHTSLVSKEGLYIVLFYIYFFASIGLLFNYRWAWIISIIFLGSYWILRGWIGWIIFVVNFKLFLEGHELYRDSLATIFVVFIYALFGIFPATCLTILGAISSGRIIKILRGTEDDNICRLESAYPI